MMSLSIDVANGNNRIECLQAQAIHTCGLQNWSGLIHIMALASVLKRPIFSVYPKASPLVRPLFHGLIRPRHLNTSQDGTHANILYIMFTRDSDLDSRKSAEFQPNHFCPLIVNDTDAFLLNESEFPPLCPEFSSKDFPVTIKQEKKTFRPLKHHRQNRTNGGNGKKPKATLSSFFSSEKLLSESKSKNPIKVPAENVECWKPITADSSCLISSDELLSESNAKDLIKIPTENACYGSNSANETHLSMKCLSKSWFSRKGQEWSNEVNEDHIAPVLNKSAIKNHRQHRTNVDDGKKPKAALSCFISGDELLSESNAKDPNIVPAQNACHESSSTNETLLSMKCLSRSWFSRKGQEWSNERDENHIAPVLNKSEFQPLCSELLSQKEDFQTTLKQERKKSRPIKNHQQHRTNVDDGKKPKAALSCFISGDELLSESNAKDPIKIPAQNACLESNSANETHLSMMCLSRLWFSRKGQEWSNEKDENHTAALITKKWYNSAEKEKDKSSDNLKDVTSDKNTNLKLEVKALSKKWFSRCGRLAAKKWGRSSPEARKNVSTGNSSITVIKNSSTTGSIDKNIENIIEELSRTTSRKRKAELTGLLAVGELIKSSCVTSTQEAGKVYINARSGEGSKKMTSSYLFDYFSRYFNIVQFYLYGRSYIIENRNQKFDVVIGQLQNITANHEAFCNKTIEGKIGTIFANAIHMMDTKRDKDILKGIFSHATSVKFVSKLQQVQNKTAIMNCRDELEANITTFQEIQKTSRVVRNDMTNSQQSRLQKRIIQRRKDNEMKSRVEQRGRMMKCEEWPELAQTLEYIFGEFDQKDKSGGGLEAHARLKNNNMYRCKDNNTFMRQALDIVNSVSPPSFNISLSSCFNYTMTYKRNTESAKRHHHGKGVNANISLHHPPKTQVKNLVVNLHYSTANVNYICDDSDLKKHNVIVDSKDAKRIVCAEICPVQKPGKTWSEIEYLDHDWDQSRTNAVTPMTHLFMDTIITERESIVPNPALQDLDISFEHTNTVLHVTRSGKAVTLVNPSLLEPDTTIKLLNEIFFLLTKP